MESRARNDRISWVGIWHMLPHLNNFPIKIWLYQTIFMSKMVHTYKEWISNRNTMKTKNLNSIISRHNVVPNLPYQRKMSSFSPNNHWFPKLIFFSSQSIEQTGNICLVLFWGCRHSRHKSVWTKSHEPETFPSYLLPYKLAPAFWRAIWHVY